MNGENGTKQPLRGAETACGMTSEHRFDISMPQCDITFDPNTGNSELP